MTTLDDFDDWLVCTSQRNLILILTFVLFLILQRVQILIGCLLDFLLDDFPLEGKLKDIYMQVSSHCATLLPIDIILGYSNSLLLLNTSFYLLL